MSVGLHLGGSTFRSLRRQNDRLLARSANAVYAIILDNPARRALFAERRVPYAEFGMNLILFGDTALEWSPRLSVSAIPLCGDSGLRIDDRVIRQVTTSLIEALLPIPSNRPAECCLTVPHGRTGFQPDVADFLGSLVRDLGYQPWFTSPSLAVGLSELAAVGMTGLGVHLGVAKCEFSIIRQGRELLQFDIPLGIGHGAIAELPGKEAAGQSTEAAEALRDIFATAAYELQRRPERKALSAPVALAVSGEFAARPEFSHIVMECVQHASWPFAVRALQLTADPQWAVCRGCLIQAELEQLTQPGRQVA